MTGEELETVLRELEAGLITGTRQGLWQSSRAIEQLTDALTCHEGNGFRAAACWSPGQWRRLQLTLVRCQRLSMHASHLVSQGQNGYTNRPDMRSDGTNTAASWEG